MEVWKRNLLICCIASFIVSVGMSQMAPILPLYIHELGVEAPEDVARWSRSEEHTSELQSRI